MQKNKYANLSMEELRSEMILMCDALTDHLWMGMDAQKHLADPGVDLRAGKLISDIGVAGGVFLQRNWKPPEQLNN